MARSSRYPRRSTFLLRSVTGLIATLCSANCFLAFVTPFEVEDAARRSRHLIQRHASDEFSYGTQKASAKGFGGSGKSPKKNEESSESESEEEETGIVKDTRQGKASSLSTTKLNDLRDKTLALRQKREAELDEYEAGRAMIAKYGPKVAIMPEVVAQRAAKRGMVIGGSFYGVMLLVFGVGILLFKTQDVIIPPTLMAFITLILLGLAIAGSSYGMMSASWEEDKEGSALGIEEFGNNVKALGEGFRKLSMQSEYEKAIVARNERRKLLEAKEQKKTELLEQ